MFELASSTIFNLVIFLFVLFDLFDETTFLEMESIRLPTPEPNEFKKDIKKIN